MNSSDSNQPETLTDRNSTDHNDNDQAPGCSETLRYSVGDSWLGNTLAAFSDRGVVAILLGDDEVSLVQDLQNRFSLARLLKDDEYATPSLARIISYIQTPVGHLALPLDMRGSDFQKLVWRALREIPAGELASYSDIAKRIGGTGTARDVASACASNPIAVVIPCHRVVYNDGRYGGYAWGVKRKQRLIEREVVPVWGLF